MFFLTESFVIKISTHIQQHQIVTRDALLQENVSAITPECTKRWMQIMTDGCVLGRVVK